MKKEDSVTLQECEPLTAGKEKVPVDKQLDWYRLIHQGRLLDDRARAYIRKAMGWSYHASHAGHDGIQLALGLAFRPHKDFLFPYYRDMLTSLAAGITPYEIVLTHTDRPSLCDSLHGKQETAGLWARRVVSDCAGDAVGPFH